MNPRWHFSYAVSDQIECPTTGYDVEYELVSRVFSVWLNRNVDINLLEEMHCKFYHHFSYTKQMYFSVHKNSDIPECSHSNLLLSKVSLMLGSWNIPKHSGHQLIFQILIQTIFFSMTNNKIKEECLAIITKINSCALRILANLHHQVVTLYWGKIIK